MYEHISNEKIIAGVAVRSILTPYELRLAAGERIRQQAEMIDRLTSEVRDLRARIQQLENKIRPK